MARHADQPFDSDFLYRSSDPPESREAALRVVKYIPHLQTWVAHCVAECPGLTAMELARYFGQDDTRRIGRRLKECERKRLVVRGPSRQCSVTNHRAATWLPVEASTDEILGDLL